MSIFKTRNIFILFVLSIIAFSIMVFIGDYNEIIKQLSKVNIVVLFIMILLTFGNQLLRFLKWQLFLNVLAIRVNFIQSFMIFLSGFSMGLTPGKIGETVKSYLLYKKYNTDISRSVPIILVERLTDLIGLIILSLLGFYFLFSSFYYIVFIMLILIGAILLTTNKNVFNKLENVLSRINLIKKYLSSIKIFHNSLKTLLSPKSMVLSIALSIVSWSLEGVALYFLISSLGIDVNILSIVSVYSFSSIVGALAIIPGGIGVTEGSLLSLLLLLNIPLSIASLSTIIIRLTTLWFGITIGMSSLFIAFRKQLK